MQNLDSYASRPIASYVFSDYIISYWPENIIQAYILSIIYIWDYYEPSSK